jgi:TnpA family transposase
MRLVFKVLDFQSELPTLNKAIAFLKHYFKGNKSFNDYKFQEIPIEFIPKHLRRYVITKVKFNNKKIKTIDPDRYEFMLYSCIEKNLTKGIVTVKDSISYKSLDDELISKEDWSNNKDTIIKQLETELISNDIVKIISNFEGILNTRYQEVNQDIASGKNNKIKIKYNKNNEVIKWRLPYNKLDDSVNNMFFESVNLANISQVIKFTNCNTGFMKKFTHILPVYSKNKPTLSSITACIVAKGTGNDIYKMKDISDVKEQDMIFAYNNFIRYQTISTASTEIINKIAALPIFTEYTLSDYGIHAGVDGQKLETKYNIIKARYSSKYYGLGQGISAYTLCANHLPLCTKIIGANEHESYYLLDILKSNNSNVAISTVYGDMHSINRVNFILLHMFGYRFMPRFKKLNEKANKNLVSFDDPQSNKYKSYLIKPSKKVNKELIIKEKDNILRIFATLALKKNTQANIIKKLSSYKSNDTLKALIELDKIVMSLYILDYISDEDMRRTVQRSLNRVESYNQLRSAIAKVSGRKLIGKTEIELIINNECARFIALCIIFYNASILSGIYEYYKNKGNIDKCRKITRVSPVAWQHINLIGKYEFNVNVELILSKTIEELVSII